MEIVKSKTGDERSLIRIDHERIRVVGESDKIKRKINKKGELVVFDYHQGPFFNVGGFVFFEKMKYKISKLTQLHSHATLKEVVLTVVPQY